ncbi:MAG: multicopper oxidase domain-containing protein [Candidatus Thiodiazotropha sp.]
MKRLLKQPGRLMGLLFTGMSCMLAVPQAQAEHDIRGITQANPTGQFNLYAFPFNMNLPEGTSLYMWGFGDMNSGDGRTHQMQGGGYALPQYPAPTLIVQEGEPVVINMTNYGVPSPVSIVVTGHNVTPTCVVSVMNTDTNQDNCDGLITMEAEVNETVSYSFTAGSPGTYIYHSIGGDNPALHTEMGLLGVMIVRPADGSRTAYGENTGTDYDQENLYLMTEIDPDIHLQMEKGHYQHFTNSDRHAKIWFINGRVFPDLFQGDFNSLFPNQPYESLVLAHPGDKVLVRNVNAGHDSHPMHYHGENLRFIGRDGKMLSSNGTDADLGRSDNTINSAPKQTVDALWTWTGKDLNWDAYGPINTSCTDSNHDMADDFTGALCNDQNCIDLENNRTGALGPDGFDDHNFQYCPDHGKELPVTLPGVGDLTLGGWWSGSPFLGDTGDLPVGEGGLNPFGGYFLVWHSHAEKELTTFDIFPGGSLGSVVIVPPSAPID